MSNSEVIAFLKSEANFGIEITFCSVFGKDALRAVRKPREQGEPVYICEQMVDIEDLERLKSAASFMREEIGKMVKGERKNQNSLIYNITGVEY